MFTFVNENSMHGFPRIFRTTSILAVVFWIIIILLTTGLFIYFIVANLSLYMAYPVSTSIQQLEVDSLIFPAIVICSQNNQISNMIIECKFNKDEECQLNETQTQGSSLSCLRFNGNGTTELRKVNRRGYGLSLALNPSDSSEVISFHVIDNYLNYFRQSEMPYYLSSGFMYDIPISLTVRKKLPMPYNSCIQSETRQKDCLAVCTNSNFIDKQKCTLPGFQTTNLASCSGLTIENFHFAYENDCKRQCELECTTKQYSIDYSSRTSPVSNQMITANFYFPELSYQEWSQTPKLMFTDLFTSMAILSSVLFGLSFLSFFEIFQFFFELCGI